MRHLTEAWSIGTDEYAPAFKGRQCTFAIRPVLIGGMRARTALPLLTRATGAIKGGGYIDTPTKKSDRKLSP